MRRRAWPRSRRSPTTRRSAAIRATRAGRCRSASTLARSMPPAARSNAGRSVAVPTTVGFCMYIRRAALDRGRRLRRRGVRPRLRRGERLLHARQRSAAGRTGWPATRSSTTKARSASAPARTSATARRRHGQCSRGAIRDYARLVDAACQGRRGGAVPLRGDRGAVPPHPNLPVMLMVSHIWAAGCSGISTTWSTRLAGRANVLLLHDSTARGARCRCRRCRASPSC